MKEDTAIQELFAKYVITGRHDQSDYFGLIRALLEKREISGEPVDEAVGRVYQLIRDELVTNHGAPRSGISFGTSGWRGILGKDVYLQSIRWVTSAIIRMYRSIETHPAIAVHLGVDSLAEAQQRGCLVGHDNRFGGDALARAVAEVLCENGFRVYFCGESTTGVLSAALLELGAAFSVNLTPSHNPLDYGGYKFNAADGGPAATELTSLITTYAREAVGRGDDKSEPVDGVRGELVELDSFDLWRQMVVKNCERHGIEYQALLEKAAANADLDIVIDSVHGASRLHIERLLGPAVVRLTHLRSGNDPTFGGIAPEPSSINMKGVTEILAKSGRRLKIGAIIDPDADRIRFTDGSVEISMNQFGAMAYYFLHEYKEKSGMVAKTVATSNLANAVARGLGEQVFETKVGFKEFKPVIGKALVCFEESDGISVVGHTPEKDAYIGLMLALDMVLTTGRNLGELLAEVEGKFGVYCPERDGVTVALKGAELEAALAQLEKYRVGATVSVGGERKVIGEVIAIDGRKMIFEDDSWIMIRPSGTEPKVRFYVESRTPDGAGRLVAAARLMLAEAGLLVG